MQTMFAVCRDLVRDLQGSGKLYRHESRYKHFRAIPLIWPPSASHMGPTSFHAGTDTARLTAGPVVFYLGAICVALYCTAATIIRQIIGIHRRREIPFPAIGYTFALLTLVSGALHLFVAMDRGTRHRTRRLRTGPHHGLRGHGGDLIDTVQPDPQELRMTTPFRSTPPDSPGRSRC